MTAAQALMTSGAASAHATSRGSAMKDHAASSGEGEVGFEDVLDGAGREEHVATKGPGRDTHAGLHDRVEGDERALREQQEAAVPEQLPTGTTSGALAQALASLASASMNDATPATQPVESAEEVLTRLLEQAKAVMSNDAEMPTEGASADELAEIKAAVEATGVSVRGEEKHLAPVKPLAAMAEAAADASAEQGREIANRTMFVAGGAQASQAQAGQASRESKLDASESLRGNTRGIDAGNADRESVSDATGSDLTMEVDEQAENGDSGGAGSNNAGSNGASGGAPGGVLVGPAGLQSTGRAGGTESFARLMSEASPASQVAARVTTEMSGGDIGGAAVKVLHLELSPENLGTVTVRVSLKDDVISLHMEAQRPETALAIEREREALSAALKQAGYIVDQVTTQQADPRAFARVDGAQSTSSGSMSPQGQGGGQGFDQPANSNSGDGQRGQQNGRGAGNDTAVNNGRTAPLSGGGSGALYV